MNIVIFKFFLLIGFDDFFVSLLGSRLIFIQVLIVAGGFSKNTDQFDSTEKLVMLPGKQWTPASSLPRRSAHMASISLHNKIYLLGQ